MSSSNANVSPAYRGAVWPRVDGLRAFGLGTPGPMRDRLNALVLGGQKIATAGLWQQEYVEEDEDLDRVGERQVLLDSREQALAVVEITRVEVFPFFEVPWEFANDEGEGFTSVEDWRRGHIEHWKESGVKVTDSTRVVCVWFRLV